jgi:hypothetical protein
MAAIWLVAVPLAFAPPAGAQSGTVPGAQVERLCILSRGRRQVPLAQVERLCILGVRPVAGSPKLSRQGVPSLHDLGAFDIIVIPRAVRGVGKIPGYEPSDPISGGVGKVLGKLVDRYPIVLVVVRAVDGHPARKGVPTRVE